MNNRSQLTLNQKFKQNRVKNEIYKTEDSIQDFKLSYINLNFIQMN